MRTWKLAAAVAMTCAFDAAAAATIEGTYNTGASEETDAPAGTLDVRFHPCPDDPSLSCGSIVAIRDPDPDQASDVMPDGTPILGFTMIRELKHEGDGRFRDGQINAVDESLSKDKMVWYGVKIDTLADGRLKLKGCLGFICPRTMYWSPLDAPHAAAVGGAPAGE